MTRRVAVEKRMGIPQLGFVTGLLYAVRRAGRARADPPDSLRCPITQELFRDPVVVTQTGRQEERGVRRKPLPLWRNGLGRGARVGRLKARCARTSTT